MTDTAVASLVRAEHAFARDVAARRLDGWVDGFAADGAMLPQRAAFAVGRDAVRRTMARTFADTSVRVVWRPVYAEVARSGELGFTYGYARWSWRDSTGAVAASGSKYGTVWRRDAVGRWKVLADFGNDAPVPAGFFEGRDAQAGADGAAGAAPSVRR